MALCFRLPEDAYHPPAMAVIEQLDGVDATLHGLLIRRLPRFVRTEDLGQVVVGVYVAGDLPFVDTLAVEDGHGTADVFFQSKGLGNDVALGTMADGNEVLRAQRATAIGPNYAAGGQDRRSRHKVRR